MKESESGEVEIRYDGFVGDRDAFLTFLAYLYTGDPELINRENVIALLGASQFYQVCGCGVFVVNVGSSSGQFTRD